MKSSRHATKESVESETVTLVCPSCLTRYTCRESEIKGGAKLCDDCHVPLVQEGRVRRPGRSV